jgi:hypothetical protein
VGRYGHNIKGPNNTQYRVARGGSKWIGKMVMGSNKRQRESKSKSSIILFTTFTIWTSIGRGTTQTSFTGFLDRYIETSEEMAIGRRRDDFNG